MEMSRLTRDGTAEPVSRDQILRRERRQGNINFPCSAKQDWQPSRLIRTHSRYMCAYTKGTGTRVGSGMAKKRLRSARIRRQGGRLWWNEEEM